MLGFYFRQEICLSLPDVYIMTSIAKYLPEKIFLFQNTSGTSLIINGELYSTEIKKWIWILESNISFLFFLLCIIFAFSSFLNFQVLWFSSYLFFFLKIIHYRYFAKKLLKVSFSIARCNCCVSVDFLRLVFHQSFYFI